MKHRVIRIAQQCKLCFNVDSLYNFIQNNKMCLVLWGFSIFNYAFSVSLLFLLFNFNLFIIYLTEITPKSDEKLKCGFKTLVSGFSPTSDAY